MASSHHHHHHFHHKERHSHSFEHQKSEEKEAEGPSRSSEEKQHHSSCSSHHHPHHYHHHHHSISDSPTQSRFSSHHHHHRHHHHNHNASHKEDESENSTSTNTCCCRRKSSSYSSKSNDNSSDTSCDDDEFHLIVFPGDKIAHRYKVTEIMGEGKFSKVVEAHDETENKIVAIKIVRSIKRYLESAEIEIEILEAVRKHDDQNHSSLVVAYGGTFNWKGHICIVFEWCGISLYDFLVKNRYIPFSMDDIREISRQLIHSLKFIHEMKLIHTDLKPENIMFVKKDYKTVQLTNETCANSVGITHTTTRIPISTEIRLIDLGNAVWGTRSHTSTIATRHYRPPEVLLGLEWSFPSDMFSVGCILIELFIGDVLFQTHHNREHLAMMEKVLGQIPPAMARNSGRTARSYFDETGHIIFPEPGIHESVRHLNAVKPLDQVIPRETYPDFFDLVARLLEYDPSRRITAAQCLEHPFFNQKIVPMSQ